MVWAIFRRELAATFRTLVGPVAVVGCLLLFGVTTFYLSDLFARGVADLVPLFQWGPLVLALTVPVITMRLMAEERRSGTLELVRSLPIQSHELVLGKFLAGLTVIAMAVAGTLPYPLTVSLLGPLEAGPVLAGYLGLLLLAAALVAVGLLVSCLTESQAAAFFITESITVLWWAAGRYADHAPLPVARALEFVSIHSRFTSVARGVVDSRDLLAFAAVTTIALAGAAAMLRRERLRQ